MPTICPHSVYDPLGPQTERRMTGHEIVCLHTMAGYFNTVDESFHRDGYGGLESHFGVREDGFTKQWQDLDYQADANLDGNPYVISIETADYDHGTYFPSWKGSDVPAWSDEQVDKIVTLLKWLCDRYRIPRILIPDTQPGQRGIGYHRQGIDPWRHPNGVRWSNARGKVCPGDRRIHQLQTIIIPRLQKRPTQTTLLGERKMTLIRKRSNGNVLMLIGETLLPVTGPANWDEAGKGGVPRIILDDDEYDRIVAEFGITR
jgi:hypothetical protein